MSQPDIYTDADASADNALVLAIADGSADALSALYDRYASIVFGLAKRVTSRQEDAEEVVQDVFAQVWRQASRYESGRATVAGWLVMLTRTRAIDRVRARVARPDQNASVPPESAPHLAMAGPDPEAVSISADDVRQVRTVLSALPDGQRSLVEMAYYEGLTHTEIADRTGIALGTVKTRLRAAMAALRQALQPPLGLSS